MSSIADAATGSAAPDTKRGAIHPPSPRLSHEFRNGDFLSRLLAATPPYLYNIPLVPQSFFFSDMLKSFVRSTKEATSEPNELPSGGRPPHRRRKRTWREMNDVSSRIVPDRPAPIMEKPLELTNNNRSSHEEESSIPPTIERTSPSNAVELPSLPHLMLPPCSMFPLPSSDHQSRISSSTDPELLSTLPPFPPPLWYPSLYPGLGSNIPSQSHPYGIDPLHFFIDLRVSGHIWDRKSPYGTPTTSIQTNSPTAGLDCTVDKQREEATRIVEVEETPGSESSPLNLTGPVSSTRNLILGHTTNRFKHTSAFSVPEPRPLMMTVGKNSHRKSPADSSTKKSIPTANYVLQNLPRIYEKLQPAKHLTADANVKDSSQENEEKNESAGEEKRCKDLPALIGLELVVDYVKQEDKPGMTPAVESGAETTPLQLMSSSMVEANSANNPEIS